LEWARVPWNGFWSPSPRDFIHFEKISWVIWRTQATTMYAISWFCFYSGHWTTPMINLVFNWRWSLHIRHVYLLFILFHHYSTPRDCLTVRWVRVVNVLKKVIWQPQYTGKDAEYRFYKIHRGWHIYSVNLRWNIWWRNLYESAEHIIDVFKRFSMHI
jgi:hypothetical protein